MPRHTAHAEALAAAEELRGDDASSQEDTGFMVVWGWERAGFLGGAQPNVLVPCYEERERTEPSLEGGGTTFPRSNLSPVAQLPNTGFSASCERRRRVSVFSSSPGSKGR